MNEETKHVVFLSYREVWKKFGGVISLKFDKNKNKAGVSFVPFHDRAKSLDWRRIVEG